MLTSFQKTPYKKANAQSCTSIKQLDYELEIYEGADYSTILKLSLHLICGYQCDKAVT